MKHILTLLFLFFVFTSGKISAQSNPLPLYPGITITRILTVKDFGIRVEKDPVSGNLFYNTGDGNIYEIIQPAAGNAYDSLVYTTADHGIDYPQDFTFRGNILYIFGINTPHVSFPTDI